MYCTQTFAAPFDKLSIISAECSHGLYFLVNGTSEPLSKFSCKAWPKYTARRTGRSCNGGSDLLEVGFEVSKGLLQTMDICYDEVNQVTRYVHHILDPSSQAFQTNVPRPRFAQLDFFGSKDVDKLYSKPMQMKTFSTILGMDASQYFNDSKDVYIGRGHMAAKSDFVFSSPQRSTFLFVNVAPQWQAFNGGNWENIENGVRSYVANKSLTVDCYSGIWGVSTLPDVNGTQKELYLSFDEKKIGTIPVPKIYFRVVIDRKSRNGIVLVGVNNPHATRQQIEKEYVICNDISDKIGWVNWSKEDLPKGYSYACSVPDFVKVVKNLPLEDLQTTEGPGTESSSGVVVKGNCAFRVTGDQHDPAPLFTYHKQYEWLIPNAEGIVEIKNGQFIDMYCTEAFAAPFDNISAISAQCLQGLYFLVNGTIYPFNNFSCTAWPTYTARRTGRTCNGGTDLLEVGFEVSGGFLQTMDICHDEINEVTRYVHHVLNPSSTAFQRSVARPRFVELDFYGGKNVDKLYTKVEQNNTISSILGMDASQYFNDSINIFMARGHMAAKSDFIFSSPQRATFLLVNAAPQWHAFNSGNWERVEDGVRKYVSNNGLTVDCYTGIWGVSTLPDVNGTQKELYLSFDENNNGLIPVPKIYFRVVIERSTRKGIVLIGVNNPHASLEQVKKEYIICEDIGDKIDWIQWDKEDLIDGYSYACSVPDFLRVVKDLPVENLETTGVLGINEVGCSFRVSGDLNDPAPLFSKAGVYDWIVPKPNGLVELHYGESIDMYCTKAFLKPFEKQTKITAQCLKGYEYLVNGERYNISTFSCSAWPMYTARRTGRPCNGGTDLLEVGFNVSGGFLQTMDICHDEINEVTRYVHHVLNPSSSAYQRAVKRPRFIEGDFYAGKNVDNLYTKVQQNKTISSILGLDASPYFNYSKDIYLARGHMAAKVDFIFASPQRSTFFFLNVAPQWQVFNAGNWERIEDGVRNFVSSNDLTVDCYTGNWGVATLPDVNGTPRELYLAFDENNNGLIPVPKIYFRVVIDRESRKGIVLVGVNNPHATLQQIEEEYIICNDIGDEIDWINWSKEDLLKGYSYACSVPEFLKVVKDLPLENLKTTGILGINELLKQDV
ncbi:uncharacterized protein ACRADG_001404 [Cochliomyia hominivorax]